ncbi:MAG: 2-hydroxyacyl-CoA dehydratase, partial [Deltaproteobacteria bacterium]|nr:2-hydroxyacyl-CoA dehydratase [Deltaproteobacteria bacterium]
LEPLKEFAKELESAPPVTGHRARLVFAGSNCDDPGYIKIIEKTGGLVVADRTCTGSIPGLSPIAEDKDPVEALAARYLSNISCPRMMEEFDARVAEILDAVSEYKADGIILQTMKFCDTWGVEAAPMVESLREAGVPILRLEREYASAAEGQLQTRVQAFLESLGK